MGVGVNNGLLLLSLVAVKNMPFKSPDIPQNLSKLGECSTHTNLYLSPLYVTANGFFPNILYARMSICVSFNDGTTFVDASAKALGTEIWANVGLMMTNKVTIKIVVVRGRNMLFMIFSF